MWCEFMYKSNFNVINVKGLAMCQVFANGISLLKSLRMHNVAIVMGITFHSSECPVRMEEVEVERIRVVEKVSYAVSENC